jgi:methyl-accepting chemotaxis protein
MPTKSAKREKRDIMTKPMAPRKIISHADNGSAMALESAQDSRSGDSVGESRIAARKMAEDRARARTLARAQQVAERLSTATQECSAAITEASSAVTEMEKTMQSIASGATEAAAAADETRAATARIETAGISANQRATASLQNVNSMKDLLRTTAGEIDSMIKGVGAAAASSLESAKMIAELENQSKEIGKIVHAVARIADQTNLLALNAAIEAARAGDHGKGFAVVADEVRNLAELSEKSARGIQDVVNEIQAQVKVVASDTELAGKKGREEVEKAKVITTDLTSVVASFDDVLAGCQVISKNSQDALAGAKEYMTGAEQIASAAEEANAAVTESLKAIQEQSKAFNEMSSAAQNLNELAESLKTSTNAQKSSEELAAAAEEMSANAEEVRASAGQIAAAITQIDKAAELQLQAARRAMDLGTRLENGAKGTAEAARTGQEKCTGVRNLLTKNKTDVDDLVFNISKMAVAASNSSKNVVELSERTRRIDKIVDAIVMVTVQTNMLAVNGNVEAARAGEFGRGFSVVAGDIRSLANESSQNADLIKDRVREIQQQIHRVATDIDLAGKSAAGESERAKATTANLINMAKGTEEILKGVVEIANGTQETLTALQESAKAAEQIAAAGQQMKKATQESAIAAKESQKASQEIAQASEDISSQADEMQNA